MNAFRIDSSGLLPLGEAILIEIGLVIAIFTQIYFYLLNVDRNLI
jgi:hypothetical protein